MTCRASTAVTWLSPLTSVKYRLATADPLSPSAIALRESSLKTDLLPRELVHDRMIREKKPWAVAAAAVLLLAFTIGFVSLSRALGTMDESVYGASVKQAEQVLSRVHI